MPLAAVPDSTSRVPSVASWKTTAAGHHHHPTGRNMMGCVHNHRQRERAPLCCSSSDERGVRWHHQRMPAALLLAADCFGTLAASADFPTKGCLSRASAPEVPVAAPSLVQMVSPARMPPVRCTPNPVAICTLVRLNALFFYGGRSARHLTTHASCQQQRCAT